MDSPYCPAHSFASSPGDSPGCEGRRTRANRYSSECHSGLSAAPLLTAPSWLCLPHPQRLVEPNRNATGRAGVNCRAGTDWHVVNIPRDPAPCKGSSMYPLDVQGASTLQTPWTTAPTRPPHLPSVSVHSPLLHTQPSGGEHPATPEVTSAHRQSCTKLPKQLPNSLPARCQLRGPHLGKKTKSSY